MNINQHEVADAFWKAWKENGETGKHGYYESTWIAIRAALKVAGVTFDRPSDPITELIEQAQELDMGYGPNACPTCGKSDRPSPAPVSAETIRLAKVALNELPAHYRDQDWKIAAVDVCKAVAALDATSQEKS